MIGIGSVNCLKRWQDTIALVCILLVGSCVTKRQSHLPNDRISSSQNAGSAIELAAQNLSVEQFLLIEECGEPSRQCVYDISDGSQESLPRYFNESGSLSVSVCDGKECRPGKTTTLNELEGGLFLEVNRSQRDLRASMSAHSLYLGQILKTHIDKLQHCRSDAKVRKTGYDLDRQRLQPYLEAILPYQDKSEVELMTALASAYAQPQPNSLAAKMAPSGFQLAEESPKNIRVTVFNFEAIHKEGFRKFLSDQQKNSQGALSDFKAAVVEYYHQNNGQHAAVLIERYNQDKNIWELQRYVSYPSGNDAGQDIHDFYKDNKMTRTVLPLLTEDDYFRFEDWFKFSKYNHIDFAESQRLREERRVTMGALAETIDFPSDKISGLKESRGFRNAILNAIRLKKEQTQLENELAAAKEKGGLAPEEKAAKKLKIKDLDAKVRAWQDSVSELKGRIDKLDQKGRAKAKDQVYAYLLAEVETSRLMEPVSIARELERQINLSNKIKRATLLPSYADLARVGFNPSRPNELKSLEGIFQSHYKIDPRDKAQWDKFVDNHADHVKTTLEDYRLYELPEGSRTYDEVDKLTDLWVSDRAKFVIEIKKMGWKGYLRTVLVDSDELNEYNKITREVYDGGKSYGKDFDIRKNNCACAAGQALDKLYNTKYFTDGTGMATPNNISERAAAFARHGGTPPKARGHVRPLTIGAASVVGIGIVGAIATGASVFTKDESEDLALSEVEAAALEAYDYACVDREYHRFLSEADEVFGFLNAAQASLSIQRELRSAIAPRKQ